MNMPSLLRCVTLAFVGAIAAGVAAACGGSSSETPPPVEPSAHELSPSGPVLATSPGGHSDAVEGESNARHGANGQRSRRYSSDAGLF
jgi:hypothetical protein